MINIKSILPAQKWSDDSLTVYLLLNEAPSLAIDQKSYIYLNHRHIKTQTEQNIYQFLLFRLEKEEPLAFFYLISDECNEWNSPAKAPFGGIQSLESCSSYEVIFLLKCVENFVKKQGGKKIVIKTAPQNYDIIEHAKLYQCYKHLNYEEKQIVNNHDISVSDIPFEEIITCAERRRLKKCRRAGFITIPMQAENISTIYGFIRSVRNHFGYALSISSEELRTLFITMPDKVKVFSVNDGDRLIALSVTIRVNTSILYNFLIADLPEYRSFSPAVTLLEGIYHYCQTEKIRMLDLGISLDHNGVEKPSLIRFKESLGATASRKITWQKALDT